MKNNTETIVELPKPCDFCTAEGDIATDAIVDGKTTFGPWANMCDRHFEAHGVGLGLGRGQRLIVRSES
jgi:hypothetical protein